jgi:hypothetical protein
MGAAFEWAEILISRRYEVDQVPVLLSRITSEPSDRALAQISAALALLARYAPAHLRRLRERVRAIMVCRTTWAWACWLRERRVIKIREDHVTTATPERLAATLVHELTHARLSNFPYGEAIRIRLERACVRAELGFARRLPDGGAMAAEISARLASLSAEDYTDAQFEDRQRELADKAYADLRATLSPRTAWIMDRVHPRVRDWGRRLSAATREPGGGTPRTARRPR